MGLLDKLIGRKEEETESFKPASVDVTGQYDIKVRDRPDARVIKDFPELQTAIAEYQSPDNVEKREIFAFEEAMKNTPDYYLPYYWVATYHYDKGNFDEARKVLLDGIAKSSVKSVLCRRLGEFYYAKEMVDDAIYWFFTTIMADASDIDYHSYLFLGYMFEAYGMKKASQWARRRAHGIAYKLLFEHVEYSHKKKDWIMSAARRTENERTARKLNDLYLYAKPRLKNL